MTKSWILAGVFLLVPLKAAAAGPTGMELGISVEVKKAARPETALKEAEQVIARRLHEAGAPAWVKPSGTAKNHLNVVIPRTEDPEQILRLVRTRGFLELRFVRFPTLGGMAREEILWHFKGQLPADLELLEEARGDGKITYAVERDPVITGADIKTVRPGRGQFNNPIVQFRLKKDAAEVFGKATAANIGSPLAVVLDGKVVSAPVINARIGEEGILEGAFTEAEALELVILLRSGPLPASVKPTIVHYSKPLPAPLPARGLRRIVLGGCAFAFLLFLATLVWLYRRSDPARRKPGG